MSEPTQPPPLKQPSADCKHEEFAGGIAVNRLNHNGSPNAKPHAFLAEVRVQCAQCGGDFMFTGLPFGVSLTEPGRNITGTAATLPMKPWEPLKVEVEGDDS